MFQTCRLDFSVKIMLIMTTLCGFPLDALPISDVVWPPLKNWLKRSHCRLILLAEFTYRYAIVMIACKWFILLPINWAIPFTLPVALIHPREEYTLLRTLTTRCSSRMHYVRFSYYCRRGNDALDYRRLRPSAALASDEISLQDEASWAERKLQRWISLGEGAGELWLLSVFCSVILFLQVLRPITCRLWDY